MTKARLVNGAALIALAWGMALPGRAAAQDAVAAAAADDEIIVTARRQNENLQDVPAAITVFTAETLSKAGITRTEDFVQLTPGVTIVTGTAEVGDTQINIRGINGARDAEPSVALVVDGILKTNTAALAQDQGDLNQVEVLKGPQGAIYGRNAAAGAVVLTTRKPGDRAEGRFRASGAENSSYEGFGSLSGPLTETIGALISGEYRRTDGYFRNTGPIVSANGATVDKSESYNINGRIVITPSDAFELDAKAKYGHVRGNSIAFNASFALPLFAQFLSNPDFFEDVNGHDFQFQSNIVPTNKQRTWEGSVKATYDFGAAVLTGYVAYSDIKQSLTADGTSGAFGFFNADAPCRASVAALSASGFQLPSPQALGPTPEASILGPYTPTQCDGTQFQRRDQRDISGEIRLSSNGDGPLRWQVGGYYLNIDRTVGVNLGIDRGFGIIEQLYTADPRNPTEQLVADNFRTNVYAAFGSVGYDISEQFKVDAALRFDSEHRKVRNLVPATARTQYVDFDGFPFTGNAPLNPGLLSGAIAPQSATFEQLQPKISAAWEPSRDLTIYADWGVGFKAGGFNNSGSRATIDINFNVPLGAGINIFDQFRKEQSSAFEAGFKGRALDGALTFEGAGYYTRVRDMQFFEFFVGTFGLLRVVSNIDRVELYGGELSANLRLVKGFNVFASGNYTHSEIKKNSARPDTVGNKSPYTADYTINLGAQLDAPLTDTYNLLFRADYRITGPTWFSTVQDQMRPTLFGVPGDYSRTERSAFGVLNLRFGIERDGLSLTAFATNLMDRKYLAEVIPAAEFGGSFTSPGARRKLGIEAQYRF